MNDTTQVAIRFPDLTLQRIDKLRLPTVGGARPTRSDVIRALVDKALKLEERRKAPRAR